MVRPKSGGSNCEQGISEEWAALQNLIAKSPDEQPDSEIAGELLQSLSDWNDFLERYVPHYANHDSSSQEPGL